MLGQQSGGRVTPVATLSDAAAIHRDLLRIGRATRSRSVPGPLSTGQLSALWTVALNGPIRATELASRESVAGPTMSRMVACLEQSGMVDRTTDPNDGRVSLLAVTDAGMAYVQGASSRKSELLERALGRLDLEDRTAVRKSLRLLADTLCDLDSSPTNYAPTEEGNGA